MDNTDGVRLDRWLWSARFFKTRQMAADAVRSGRVLLNDKHTKPAKSVRIGDQVRIRKAAFRYAVHVTALSETRVGAGHAVTCLLYTSPSPRDQRGSRMPSSA